MKDKKLKIKPEIIKAFLYPKDFRNSLINAFAKVFILE
jgi:hypothetical protein